jgi:hypothetical protein
MVTVGVFGVFDAVLIGDPCNLCTSVKIIILTYIVSSSSGRIWAGPSPDRLVTKVSLA